MSTMLLIERIPTLSIFARNHCGLERTFTLSILRAEKNGHSRVALMLTPFELYGVCVSPERFRGSQKRPTIFLFVSAAISRASPKWLSKSPRFGVISTSRMVSAGKRSLIGARSEEHTSELQSHSDLVCRLLLEKK